MKVEPIGLNFDHKHIEIEQRDYKNVDSNLLAQMVFQVSLIREFENTLLKLSSDGCIHGPVHTSIGEEACAAGAMATLRPTDKIASTHRAHHHYLAKAISYYCAKDFNPVVQDIPDEIIGQATTLMGEVMGLAIGCCGGRGGSMHLRNAEIGVIGTNAIVAGGIPFATGAAFALKYCKSTDVVIAFLGDGAVNQGSFHEALNLASIWKLPIVYFIENNLYAVATSIEKASAIRDLSTRAAAYGLCGRTFDGMNPLAAMLATQEAVDHVRNCGEPIVIEAKCYRFPHHAGPIPGSAYGYRTKEEEKQWQQQDPYITFSKELIDNGIFSVDQIERLQTKAVNVVKSAAAHCATSKDDKFFVREELWPKPASLLTGLRGDGKEFNGITFNEREDFSRFESRTYVEAIAAVTGKHLEKDERVFVLGEEVASFGGGPYSATKGLPAKYPARVMNTPISECGFSGLAGGAAACGLRPIVEIMFPDFALVAADQLFNQIGKLRHIYGNSVEMPIVVRTRIAIGCGYGGQHSMDPVGQYSLWSGWRILAPSSAFDYIGLFNSAMQCNDPVLIVEHNGLYALKSEVPENNLDYFVQMGKARVVRSGRDITILCYSSTVMLVEKVAKDLEEAEGISVEIIDLRTLSFADIDYETIGESLKKTGVLATVEQAPSSMSIGPVIACQCQKRFFDYFDAPPVTIAGADIPIPVSKVLEAAAVPTFESVREMIRKAVRRES